MTQFIPHERIVDVSPGAPVQEQIVEVVNFLPQERVSSIVQQVVVCQVPQILLQLVRAALEQVVAFPMPQITIVEAFSSS